MAQPRTLAAPAAAGAWISTLAPGLFVLLWSTGFIGAKFGLPYAEPFTFLAIRFAFAATLLSGLALALGASWPRSPRLVGHIAVSGLLLHGAYLGGVFSAIHLGMPAGLAALIVGLQPVLTAVGAQALLGERVVARQWLGLALGFCGVALVVGEKLFGAGTSEVVLPAVAFVAAGIGLLGGTLGTIYQRRYCTSMDLTSGTTIQYLAAGAVMLLAALLTESMQVQWTWPFIAAMAWLVLVLSLGAITLLMVLIRRSSAARVASLFYLVPPATAIEAYLLFGERLGLLALGGMGLVALGVLLVNRVAK